MDKCSLSCRALIPWLGLLLLGCAAQPKDVDSLARPERQRVLHGELVHDMLVQGRNHAALAHLEELERQQGKLDADQRLLRAEAYYRIGETAAARADYEALLDGPQAGQAWHGLGRIALNTDLRQALQAFNSAVAARPTDAAVRNDLGYALLLAGRADDACRHLYTAHELDPQQSRIVANLLLCEGLRANREAEERLLQLHQFTRAEREHHRKQLVELSRTIERRRAELNAPAKEITG